jgi:hypothetical protein
MILMPVIAKWNSIVKCTLIYIFEPTASVKQLNTESPTGVSHAFSVLVVKLGVDVVAKTTKLDVIPVENKSRL